MIRVNNIGKKYKDSYVFKDVSFTIKSGEMTAIIGESGSGKTTLLNCIGQLEPLSHGSVVVDGEVITKKNLRKFFKDTAGFLFQNFALIDNETVRKNLEMVTKDTEKISSLLKKFGIGHVLNTKVYKLSGGEQQRVALVRVILKDPKIIFADEPTASLDRKNGKIVLDALNHLNNEGKTIIVVTHDRSLLGNFDRVIDLSKLKELQG